MPQKDPLVLGTEVNWSGDITRNKWIGARSGGDLEKMLGFAPGRLSAGWQVLLLKQTLVPEDFKFAGLTMRSGGREGLPAKTWAADVLRRHVDDSIRSEYGDGGYAAMKSAALRSQPQTGDDRFAKVVPNTWHDPDVGPDRQYPMGGGALQWKLVRSCRFLVAMSVDGHGIATIASTPPKTFFLGASASYNDRAEIHRFLSTA